MSAAVVVAPPAAARRWSVRWALVLAWAGAGVAGTALALAYLVAWRAPAVGTFHDDGIYAVTAKALAEGRGYRILSLPGEIQQTKYPVLFPALLAAIWRLFPDFPANAGALKALPLLCAVLWWWVSYRFARSETGDWRVSMGVVALTAASPWVLYLSTALLSETLFALLTAAALLLITRAVRPTTLVLAAIVAAAAYWTRTAGLALMAAGAVAFLVRGRWRHAAVFLVVCAGLCAPWLWWQSRAGARSPDSHSYYSRENYDAWNVVTHFTAREKARIVTENLMGVLVAPGALMGASAAPAGVALALVAGLLALAGFASRLAQRPRPAEIFVLLYGAMALFWAWPPMRFFAPLLPLLLLYIYWGLDALCRWLGAPARARPVALVAVAVALAAQGGWAACRAARAAYDTGSVPLPGLPQDDWARTSRMFSWLRENTPSDAVLMGNLDPAMYLYTGRKSVRGFVQDPFPLHYSGSTDAQPLGAAAELLAAILRDHVRYIVCAPNRSFREGPHLARLTGELVNQHPERFRLVYRDENSAYRIYAVAAP